MIYQMTGTMYKEIKEMTKGRPLSHKDIIAHINESGKLCVEITDVVIAEREK